MGRSRRWCRAVSANFSGRAADPPRSAPSRSEPRLRGRSPARAAPIQSRSAAGSSTKIAGQRIVNAQRMGEQRDEQHDAPVAQRFDEHAESSPGCRRRSLRRNASPPPRAGRLRHRPLGCASPLRTSARSSASLIPSSPSRSAAAVHARPSCGAARRDRSVWELSHFGTARPATAFGDQHRHRAGGDHPIGVLDKIG